jgi:predicted small metal-binding protein
MEKRLDDNDLGLDCDDRVHTLPGEEVVHRIGGHIQVFHRKKQFSKEFSNKAGAAIRGRFNGGPSQRLHI